MKTDDTNTFYFLVEELSENGATVAVQRNLGGVKNVKLDGWAGITPVIPTHPWLVEVGDVNSTCQW